MTIEEQRRMLARWLAEWKIEKDLPDGHPAPMPAGRQTSSASVFTVEAAGEILSPGDIVLLPPIGETTAARPVYVALAEKRDNQWTAVPFSRFSLPATEEEFATRSDFEPTKVLCLWNAGTVPVTILSRGWRVGKLKAPDLKTVLKFLSGEKAELPDNRRGPMLRHPLDPRHDYLEEEKTLWFDFRGEKERLIYPEEAESDYPAAAEDHEESPFKPKD